MSGFSNMIIQAVAIQLLIVAAILVGIGVFIGWLI